MSNWCLVIQGTGFHHNTENPHDANVMASEFIEKLKAAGQAINHASFTHGGRDMFVQRTEAGLIEEKTAEQLALEDKESKDQTRVKQPEFPTKETPKDTLVTEKVTTKKK